MVGADRLVDKIVELYNLILALRPSRIFMLTHHMDVVGMAALWPFRDVVEFVHHADHLPALGATLPFAAHVDLTWPCHQQCKMKVGNAYFAGLQGALPLEGAPPRPPASDRIVIATCASPSKYTGLGTADHRWTDYVTIALADPRVEIVHMGPFTEELAAAVSGALTDASIDPNRYRFVGPVPSLQKALIEHQANIYLGSYPTPGGKATLEAMAAGYSPIQPIDTQMPDQLRFDMPGGMWVEINTPEQLPAALEKVLNVSPEEAETARLEVVEMNSRFERYASQGVSSTD